MTRIPLVNARDDLDPDGRGVFDWIVESRGEVSRPFQVLLHEAGMARRVAELGHVVRFESHLTDADRELVTLVTGRAHGCGFVWTSHLEAARAAGISADTISALEAEAPGLGEREATLVSFVSELCATSTVSTDTFDAARRLLGTVGVVDLVVTVGYYTMLSYAMRACDAC